MKYLNLAFFALIIILSSCGESKNDNTDITDTSTVKKDTTTAIKEEVKKIPQDRKFDDIANYLAGTPQKDDSPWKSLEENQGWKAYATKADGMWKKIKEAKYTGMREWSNKELSKPNNDGGLVFYPFSGADFIHADIFFPNADEYILIGLEPIGSLPEPEKNLSGAYFNALDQAMYHIVSLSFFRTKSMEVDLTGIKNRNLDGTLPLLMVFMKRLGNEVLYYERVAIDNAGKMVDMGNYKVPVEKDSTIYGTKIYFKRDEKVRTLYYFSADLSNPGLTKRSDFEAFLKGLKPTTTYIKSASYLMYKDYFSKIREIVLNQTQKYYLQDDSGMPIKFLSSDKWDCTYYGAYTAPISLFSNYYQKDLRKIYQEKGENVKELPFGIGYMYKEGTSNLMLAERKK